jgi:hypothetical protein
MRRALINFDLTTFDLSDNAFRVMVYLLLHANKDGDCWPNLSTIAAQTRRSERSCDFAIRELKSKKLLESHRDGNQGKGQIRYRLNTESSATSCARSSEDQAQKTTEQAQSVAPDRDRPSAKSEATKRKKCTDLAQKVNPPPTTPLICEQDFELGLELKPASSAREPFESDLAISLPTESPIVILARKINDVAERWVKSHIQTGTDADDWRLKEVLREIIARGTNVKSAKYLQPMFEELPEQKPEPLANATISTTEQPRRITTKDGKKVLIDGEWLIAASEPMPNVMPPRHQPDAYERIFTEFSNKIAAAKWPIDAKGFCLDRLDTVERTGSAESYRAKLQSIFERAAS